MKKLLMAFTVLAIFVAGFVGHHIKLENDIEALTQELWEDSNGSKYQVFNLKGTDMTHVDFFDSIHYNDDFNFTTYVVTDVDGNDIYGDMIKSKDSYMVEGDGMYLSKTEFDVDLQVGDKVMIVFENEYDDAIVDIKEIE